MCTGIEIALLAGTAASAGSMLLGNKSQQQTYTPPPVQNPAAVAPTTREPGAAVRVGDTNKTVDDATTDYKGFVEKRSFGKSLGGLGRGGLGL